MSTFRHSNAIPVLLGSSACNILPTVACESQRARIGCGVNADASIGQVCMGVNCGVVVALGQLPHSPTEHFLNLN